MLPPLTQSKSKTQKQRSVHCKFNLLTLMGHNGIYIIYNFICYVYAYVQIYCVSYKETQDGKEELNVFKIKVLIIQSPTLNLISETLVWEQWLHE